MTTHVTITNDGTAVILASPYDPALPAQAKSLGGKFSGADKTWQFDVRDEQRVRDLARQLYGTDGTENTDEATVTVRVNVGAMPNDNSGELRLAGRRLAHRPTRDETVRLAAGVVVLSGGFGRSGGSVRYPALAASDDTVLEVRDLPRPVAERMVAEEECVNFADADALNRTALLAERERLAARLVEIDALLAGV